MLGLAESEKNKEDGTSDQLVNEHSEYPTKSVKTTTFRNIDR
jgi:hypothetical protein